MTLGTVARQATLSIEILQARVLDWLPLPTLGDLPDPGIEPTSLMSPALAGRFFTTSTTWEAHLSELSLKALEILLYSIYYSFHI